MKGKILFLHGYTQNSQTFYAKTSALRKRLIKMDYDPVYLNGPISLTPADFPGEELSKFQSSDDDIKAWWVKPGQSNLGIDLSLAMETIEQYVKGIKSEEKIVGIIGFSQGAALSGLLSSSFKEKFNHDLKFMIIYSGFKLDTSHKSNNQHLKHHYPGTPIDYKILHVIGELDTVIEESRAIELQKTLGGEILKHPGGHFVPNSKMYVDQVTSWITAIEKGDENKTEEKKEDDIFDMFDKIGA